jgi:hypothetical protein
LRLVGGDRRRLAHPFTIASMHRVVQPLPWLVLLSAAVSLLVALSLLILWGKRALVRARLRKQALIAREGEARAEAILRRKGWTIEGRQVRATYELFVEGQPVAVGLRADYLVTREGHRSVAEVKTGRSAPQLTTPSTRRQLLEYRVAFGVDGVLLVDAESDRILSVEFPQIRTNFARRWGITWAVVIGLLAFGAGTWLAR